MLACKKHPRYQAIHKPRADCEVCRAIWLRKKLTARIGPEFHCCARLVIDHQSFNVGFWDNADENEWLRDQLAIALERLLRTYYFRYQALCKNNSKS